MVFFHFKINICTYSQRRTEVGDWIRATNGPAVNLRQESRCAGRGWPSSPPPPPPASTPQRPPPYFIKECHFLWVIQTPSEFFLKEWRKTENKLTITKNSLDSLVSLPHHLLKVLYWETFIAVVYFWKAFPCLPWKWLMSAVSRLIPRFWWAFQRHLGKRSYGQACNVK